MRIANSRCAVRPDVEALRSRRAGRRRVTASLTRIRAITETRDEDVEFRYSLQLLHSDLGSFSGFNSDIVGSGPVLQPGGIDLGRRARWRSAAHSKDPTAKPTLVERIQWKLLAGSGQRSVVGSGWCRSFGRR